MRPVYCTWDGKSLVPNDAYLRLATQQFVTGERYLIEEVQTRSPQNHAHFMAVMQTAWDNLPEGAHIQWPDAEALRKWALIAAGHFEAATIELEDEHEAERTMFRTIAKHPNAHLQQIGSVIVVKNAVSMSFTNMSERRFRQVKEDVFGVLSALIGVDVTTLNKEAYAAT